MLNDKILNVILIVVLVGIFVAGVEVGFLINKFGFRSDVEFESSTEINYSINCSYNSTIETAACLNSQVREFFYYNESNLNKELNESQLKEEGGVCWHYADWYYNKIKEIGKFYVRRITIKFNETGTHEFTVISGRDAYCNLDMQSIFCFSFMPENKSEVNEKIKIVLT